MASAPTKTTTINPFPVDLPEGSRMFAVELGSDAYHAEFGLPFNADVYLLTGVQPKLEDIVFIQRHDNGAGFFRLLGVDHRDGTYVLYDPLIDERVEMRFSDVLELGVKVGMMERNLTSREPWRLTA